jgi:hypothetical protein
MDKGDIFWLRGGLGKVDWTIEATSVRDRLVELQSMFISQLRLLNVPINDPNVDHFALDQHLTSIISVLQGFPALYNALHYLDEQGSGVLFGDNSHTISYEIAIRAQAGNQLCVDLCQVLNLLSPDHCAWAISNETLLRIAR